jgi:nucleoside-diphosphate-sugar epimerase
MALFLFTKAILAGEPVNVFNHGKLQRDFTYIDDIVEGVARTLGRTPEPDPAHSWAPYPVLNMGNHGPAGLPEYLDALEEALGGKAERNYLPMQPGERTGDVCGYNPCSPSGPGTSQERRSESVSGTSCAGTSISTVRAKRLLGRAQAILWFGALARRERRDAKCRTRRGLPRI